MSNKPKTQLKHLELEECNITHKGLRSILSLPEALETLYLGKTEPFALIASRQLTDSER